MGCVVLCTPHCSTLTETGPTPIVPHCSGSGPCTWHSQCDWTIIVVSLFLWWGFSLNRTKRRENYHQLLRFWHPFEDLQLFPQSLWVHCEHYSWWLFCLLPRILRCTDHSNVCPLTMSANYPETDVQTYISMVTTIYKRPGRSNLDYPASQNQKHQSHIYATEDTIVYDEICIHTNYSMDSFLTSSLPIEVPSAESVPVLRLNPGTSDSKAKTIPLHKRVCGRIISATTFALGPQNGCY